MSEFGEDQQGFYSGSYDNQAQGYDMGNAEFPQDTQFAQFDYSQSPAGGGVAYTDNSQFYAPPPPVQGSLYTGSIMTPDPAAAYTNPSTEEDYENEPPLMEELGINFDHIYQKTLAVLNPLKSADISIMQDTDLAGPLCFCMAFGGTLLLAGKVHFGYIYGIGVVGCMAMYALLNLMSLTGVSVSQIISILGYCLLPMVILSSVAIILSLQGLLGVILTGVSVMWCSVSASKLFVSALAMDHQQLLVAYPCALVYGVFALLTVF